MNEKDRYGMDQRNRETERRVRAIQSDMEDEESARRKETKKKKEWEARAHDLENQISDLSQELAFKEQENDGIKKAIGSAQETIVKTYKELDRLLDRDMGIPDSDVLEGAEEVKNDLLTWLEHNHGDYIRDPGED